MKKNLLLILLFNTINIVYCQTYQWTKTLGGAETSHTIGIKTDSQGNSYNYGSSSQSEIDLDPSSSVYNVNSQYYLLKLDSDGNFVWGKGIGEISIKSLNIDNNGDLLLTGLFYGVADFDFGVNEFLLNSGISFVGNIFILKLNSNGDFIWAKNYGGIGNDFGTSIVYDSNNNIIVSGGFEYTVDFSSGLGTQIFNANQGGGFCLKLSSNGELIWVKQISGNNINVYNAVIDSNDFVYLCGKFGSGFNYTINGVTTNVLNYNYNNPTSIETDAFIQKVNSLGDTTWAYTIRGSNTDEIRALAIDTNNNLIAYGHQGLSTIDYNPSPQVNTIPANSYHFVLKFDSNQNFSWVKGIGGGVRDCFDLKVDNNNSIYILGSFNGQVDFNPGSGMGIPYIFSSGNNIYLMNLSSTGNYNWCKYQLLHANNFFAKMTVNNSYLYVASEFNNTADFNPQETHEYITSLGYSDNYISKYLLNNLEVNRFSQSHIKLITNPVEDFIQLTFDLAGTKDIEVYNSLGVLLDSKSITSDFITIDVSGYATGVYFVRCRMGDEVQVVKVIKE